jgi:phytoene/squalene synthetase
MADESDYCASLVRDADKDRFLATLFAPAPYRPDLLTLYAFDLETAAVAHRVRDPVAGEIRLQWWHGTVSQDGGATGHPVVDALAGLLRRHDIDRSVALDLIDARRRALYAHEEITEAEFELAASENAGAIVRLAAQVLDGALGDATRLVAHHAGVAAAAAQVAPDAVRFDAKAMSGRHRGAVRALIPKLPDAVLPALLPLTLVVDDRVTLPQWRKQWILWRASKKLVRWI